MFENVSYPMDRLAHAVIRHVVAGHPDITYDGLKQLFPDGLLRYHGVFVLADKAVKINRARGKEHYFTREEDLIMLADAVIATSTQWSGREFDAFLERIKELELQVVEA